MLLHIMPNVCAHPHFIRTRLYRFYTRMDSVMEKIDKVVQQTTIDTLQKIDDVYGKDEREPHQSDVEAIQHALLSYYEDHTWLKRVKGLRVKGFRSPIRYKFHPGSLNDMSWHFRQDDEWQIGRNLERLMNTYLMKSLCSSPSRFTKKDGVRIIRGLYWYHKNHGLVRCSNEVMMEYYRRGYMRGSSGSWGGYTRYPPWTNKQQNRQP